MSDQLIGNYRIINLIGKGGMGRVYLAVHKDVPNLRVILKILSDPRLADRFKQEADKLALLDGHPNICQIKHFFHHEEDLVIAMEYIDGVTLDEKLKQEGRLPIAEAVRVVCDMLAILSYAHQRGVSHRDIKPSNVMIDKSGQVKIIDFGIAKGKTDPSLTTTGASLGTPLYMAPEQFIPRENTNYDLADIYACGTTLYLMLTGELPFKGDNEFILRDAKLAGKAPSPRSLNSGVSKDLEKIVLKALEKEPADRFASAEEMRKALQVTIRTDKNFAEAPTQAIVTGEVSSKHPSEHKRRKSRKGIYLTGGLIVAVAAAILLWLTVGPERTSQLPVSPILMEPAPGAVLRNDQPIVLRWTSSLPPEGLYKIEYSPDSVFSDVRTIRTPTDSLALPAGVPVGTYWWRVKTLDDKGTEGPPSTARILTIESLVEQGTLVVRVIPSADIYLADSLLDAGTAEVRINVDPGLHSLRLENGRSSERFIRDTVRVAAGESVQRRYQFTVPATAEAVPATTTVTPVKKTGEVRIGSQPRGATILIDGERQAEQTPFTVQLPPGRHVILVSLEVDGVERQLADTIDVVADSLHKVPFRFDQ